MTKVRSFLEEVARDAGRLALSLLGKDVREKGRGDLVTAADLASESLIIERVKHAFPRASILAEESGNTDGTSETRFIVDPIDGTTNFANRYPMFCVSIGYESQGALVAGAIYAPALDELFSAEIGCGATLNGTAINVRPATRLADSLLCTGFSQKTFARNEPYFRSIYPKCRGVRHDGSAALNLAFVAAGRFDGYWEFDLKPWDYAAGSIIVQEAGGDFSHQQFADGSTLTTASNRELANSIRSALESVRSPN